MCTSPIYLIIPSLRILIKITFSNASRLDDIITYNNNNNITSFVFSTAAARLFSRVIAATAAAEQKVHRVPMFSIRDSDDNKPHEHSRSGNNIECAGYTSKVSPRVAYALRPRPVRISPRTAIES